MEPARALALSFTALGIAACSQTSDAAAARGPNVILICLDTVRADRLGCYGYEANATTPRLDQLAREATVFEDASATAGWTKPSVPSFLTGTYPLQHGVYEGSARGGAGEVTDVLPESSTTLAEVFRSRGYATAAFVRNAQLNRGNGFEQGFDTYVDEAGDAREIRWRAQDWLAERDASEPFFLYLHLLDAHWPYPVPDEYAAKFTSLDSVAPFRGGDSRALRDAINDGARTLSAAELAALHALYDGSLRYMDDQLGKLFAHLERENLWRDAVVCVVADHGEEFLEHGRIGHGHGLYEGLLAVPWILRVPGRAAERVGAEVSLVDLFPSLLAAAGVSGVPPSEGVDRLRDPNAARPVFAEHKEPGAYQQALRLERRKLVRRFVPGEEVEPVAAIALPALGTRWEAELDLDLPDGARAHRMSPRDDPAGDPLELKGEVGGVGEGWIEVAGFRARTSEDTELYGAVPSDVASAAGIAVGAGVKVVGAGEGGELVARRIKLYPAGEEVDAELRGTVVDVAGSLEAGRVVLGGVAVAIDARTHWEDGERGPALTREAVAAFLADADEGGARARLDVASRCVDLSEDPLELRPVLSTDGCGDLGTGLDALGQDLSARRVWGAGDRRELGEAALAGLRQLGYVR